MGLIFHNIDNLWDDSECNILYVTGLPGSGKTTLVSSLTDEGVEKIALDVLFRLGISSKLIPMYIWSTAQKRRTEGKILIVEGFQLLDPELCGFDILESDQAIILVDTPWYKCLWRVFRREKLWKLKYINNIRGTLGWFMYLCGCKRQFARKIHSIL